MTGPDPDILARAQAGDRGALGELLEPEMSRVYATCRRMVGDRQDAEELAQEAMVRIIRGLPTFDGRASLSTWLTRVTINTCLTWLRSKARRSEHKPVNIKNPDRQIGELDAPAGVQSGESDDPRVARVHQSLARLKPEHRAVLVLRDVRDLDYDAIGAALDLPTGTVKSRIFRARAALREEIERAEAERAEAARHANDAGTDEPASRQATHDDL